MPGSSCPGITIRPAHPNDHWALVELIRQYYEYDGMAFNAERVAEGLSLLLRERTLGQVWTVEAGQQIAGYAIVTYGFDLEFGGRQATLTDLYLTAEHRRKGIGAAVLAHVEHECRKAGASALELQVERTNTDAAGFYRSLGYEPHDRVPMSKVLRGGAEEGTASPHHPGLQDQTDSPHRPDLALVPLSRDNVAEFSRMVVRFYAEEPAYGVEMSLSRAEEQARQFMRSPERVVAWVVAVDGEIRGHLIAVPYLSNEYGGNVLWLDELYLEPRVRRQGVGTRLCELVRAWARERGYVRLVAECLFDNVPVQRLLSTAGFRRSTRGMFEFGL